MRVFRNTPVLDLEPTFDAPPQVTPMTDPMRVDLSEAAAVVGFAQRSPLHVLRHKYALGPRDEIQRLVAFIKTQAGKWGQFFLPTWTPDLVLVNDIAAAATSLTIQPVGYEAIFADTDRLDDPGANVFIWTKDGELYLRQVTAVATGATEVLTLDEALPAAIDREDCIAGFLWLVRFLDDGLTINYQSPDHAEAELSFRQVLLKP